ncbi:LysR family transcriptional regulator [Pseudomonas sp. GD03944]|uniref:LysR family transcriptional regulator n=1 Tax=Pseudomonas sp. GD03944 TaxID=2975409 RepID=UPI0024481397|nr:LysR family transcriptional regulator [Pseudomonas sp. GD03944]MDH1262099.1 LysR family transcriptional regulator [Pseudomonas sp. GD03944]
MSERSYQTNEPLPRQQPQAVTQAGLLSDFYWYVRVIEAGGFSAAAEQTGVGKSSLSRRIAQLERQLDVQLLNRSARLCTMTTIGEQIYRHALDMINAMEAALRSAQESAESPGGLLRLAVPSALSDWALGAMAAFQRSHPRVQFALILQDSPVDMAGQRLDLALTLDNIPDMSASVVARPLAALKMAIVGSPPLLARLGHPKRLNGVPDGALLTNGTPELPSPWVLAGGVRTLVQPALIVDSTQTLLKAARAGLGLAYLPLYTCSRYVDTQELLPACVEETLPSATLYAMTPPHKGITSTARSLIEHIRESLKASPQDGIRVI